MDGFKDKASELITNVGEVIRKVDKINVPEFVDMDSNIRVLNNKVNRLPKHSTRVETARVI
jgi:hypothetical protein